jgi:serine/threonine-protein kinase RsbW
LNQRRQILLERSVPSTREELSLLPRLLEELRSLCPIADDAFQNMMIALTEAVNNAIVHGNRSDPGKTIRYRIECSDEGMHCVVEDQGTGFDPDDVANPIDPANLLREGGRGIFIIRALMRNVRLINTGNGMRIEFTAPKE